MRFRVDTEAGNGFAGRQRHDPGAVGQREGAPVGAVAPLLDASHGGGGQVAEKVAGLERTA